MPSHDTMRAYQVVRDAWNKATLAYRDGEYADHLGRREQLAYDDLVDFVEANGLNYTEWDPRGPLTDASKTTGWVGPDPRLHP